MKAKALLKVDGDYSVFYGTFLKELTDDILTLLPTVQLSVPVNCANYNKDSQAHLLFSTEEPKEPVIIVSLSERVDESVKNKYKPNNTKGARIANSMEYMEGFQFGDHLSDFESWV